MAIGFHGFLHVPDKMHRRADGDIPPPLKLEHYHMIFTHLKLVQR
jgi:hypothetical protein